MPGYLSQLRDRPLGGTNVLDALIAAAPVTPGQARSYLARFLFRGDDVLKPVGELSGGERSRLELALLGVGSTNLLLLDEPTNHLDIAAREALETFLRESASSLVIVSHDRRLLESTCDRLWVVEPTRVRPGAGRAVRWRLPGVARGRGRWLERWRRPGSPSRRRAGLDGAGRTRRATAARPTSRSRAAATGRRPALQGRLSA